MIFRNLRVGKQIGLGFLVALLFLVITWVSGTFGQREANQSLQSVYADRIVPLKGLKLIADAYAVEVIDAVNKANAGLMTGEEALKSVQNARSTIDQEWRAYLTNPLTPDEASLAAEAQKLFVPANEAMDQLTRALEKSPGPAKGTLDAYDGPLYAAIDPIGGKITELIDLQLRVAQASTEAADSRFHATLTVTGAMVASAILISLWLAFVITRSIARPLHQAVALAQAVTQGDLSRS